MKPNQLSNKTMLLAGVAISLCAGQIAHAQYTLQGNYLEVGIGADGSIINSADSSAPDNYNESGFDQGYWSHPGIIWNGAGTGFSGTYANNDFITPGTPYQMFSIGVNGGFADSSYLNQIGETEGAILPVTSTVKTGALSTLTTGTYNGVSYSQTASFGASSSIINFAMTLKNVSGGPMSDLAFATALDPDPDVFEYEGTAAGDATDVYNSINKIISPSVVSATGPLTGNTIIIQSLNGSSTPSIIGDWPYDNPYGLLSGADGGLYGVGANNNADWDISMAWDIASLAAGASVTIDYNYIINATPVTSTSPILTSPGVPDMGSTWTMMGLALVGLGYGKRFVAGKRQ